MASPTLPVAMALLTTCMACGSSSRPTTPSAVAQQPSPTPLLEANLVPASTGGAPGVYRRDVGVSLSGAATVTLQWPDGDYSLQLSVTSGTCADLSALLARECTMLGGTRPGERPGVVRSRVTAGDLISLWVLNPDPASQRFTLGVGIE